MLRIILAFDFVYFWVIGAYGIEEPRLVLPLKSCCRLLETW